MHLNELFVYTTPKERIDEAPYGMANKIKDKMNIFDREGSKGNKEVGERANEMMKRFKRYVGQVKGPGTKEIEPNILTDFLSNNGMDPSIVTHQPNQYLTPKDAEQYMMKAARAQAAQAARPQQQNQRSDRPHDDSEYDQEDLSRIAKQGLNSLKKLSDDDLQAMIDALTR